jgi:hypothetical protein
MPFIWDQDSERGKSTAIDAFLDDAAAHGVASGVAFAIHATPQGQVLVGFNSPRGKLSDLRRFEIARNLGEMYLFGIYFHEVFMKTVIARGLPPAISGGAVESTGEALPPVLRPRLHQPVHRYGARDQRAYRGAAYP